MFIIRTADDRARAVEAVRHIQANPLLSVEIAEYKPQRSKAQNRLMWKWLDIIAKYMGEESEKLHEQTKIRVLGLREVDVDGKTYLIPKSTTKLHVDEMTRYLEAIEALGNQLGLTMTRDDEYNLAMGRTKC